MCTEKNEWTLNESHCENVVPLFRRELERPVHTDTVCVFTDSMTVKDCVGHLKLT